MLDLSAIAKSFLKHTDRVVWQANLGSSLGDVTVKVYQLLSESNFNCVG